MTVLAAAAFSLGLLALVYFCGVLLYTWKSKRHKREKSRLPPLVPGLPFIGTVRGFDTSRPHITFTDWAERYGAVYRVRVLGQTIYVLNSKDAIREALVTKSQDFAGRPLIFRIFYGFHYAKDIIFATYSAKWAHMKKTASQALRQYSSGVQHVERTMSVEMESLVGAVRAHKGRPFDPSIMLLTTVVNAISATVIGRRYAYDDPQMARYKMTTRKFSESCSPVEGIELDMFPWLRFLPNSNFKKLQESREMLDALMDQELQKVKSSYDAENIRCMLDALLKARDDSCEDDDNCITDTDVRSIFIDLMVGGTLTSAIALNSFVLLMACHPHVQKSLREAVDAKLQGKQPTTKDREALPTMDSAILELLRLISHVPLGLPHYTVNNTTVGGYFVPEDTQVLFNLWSLHHDPDIWTDPWCFKYDRFLDETGAVLHPGHPLRKSLLPFGAGRRICLGETLARERLFLFTTCLLQNFEIKLPEGEEDTSSDPRHFKMGLILEPEPFNVCMVPR